MGHLVRYSLVAVVCSLLALPCVRCFDFGSWAAEGAVSTSCKDVRGDRLFDAVITDNLQEATDFFTTLQNNNPRYSSQCRYLWDRYYPLPRPKYPDSPFLRTPLMEATRKGNMAMVKLLLDQGADVNQQEGGRWTPLMWATFEGHLHITRLLISKYANLNAKDMLGETALKLAASNGKLISVKYLLSQGVDVNARDLNGRTALMGACKNGWWSVAWALVKGGADLNMKDREGRSALMLSVLEAQNIDLVKLLVENGDYWTTNTRDNDGRSAMDYASQEKLYKIMRYLATKGAVRR